MKNQYVLFWIAMIMTLAGSTCRVKLTNTGLETKNRHSLNIAESKHYAFCRKNGGISSIPKPKKNTYYHIEALHPENRSVVYVHFIERESLTPEEMSKILKEFDYNSQTRYMVGALYNGNYGYWINHTRSSMSAEIINSKLETVSGKTFQTIHSKQEYIYKKNGKKIARYYVNAIYHGKDYTLEFFLPGGSDVGGSVNGHYFSPFQDRAEQDLVKFLRECLVIY